MEKPKTKKLPPGYYFGAMLISLLMAAAYVPKLIDEGSEGGAIYRIVIWILIALAWLWSYLRVRREKR